MRKSLRKSINSYCKECTYDKEDKGSWRQQVERCDCTKCPLYDVRPKTTGKKV